MIKYITKNKEGVVEFKQPEVIKVVDVGNTPYGNFLPNSHEAPEHCIAIYTKGRVHAFFGKTKAAAIKRANEHLNTVYNHPLGV